MKKIIKDMGQQAYRVIMLCIALNIIQVWSDLKIPNLISRLTIMVQNNSCTQKDIWVIGIKVFGCALLSLLTSFVMKFFTSRIAASCVFDLRSRLYDKVLHLSREKCDSFTVPSLINRSTNDLTQIQSFFTVGLQVLIKTPILAVWTIIKIHTYDWQWKLSSGAAVGIVLIVILCMIGMILPNLKVIQTCNDSMNKIARENLVGMKIIRSFNSEQFYMNKFEKVNQEYTDASIFNAKTYSILNPSISFLTNLMTAGVYWFGALAIDRIGIFDTGSLLLRSEKFGDMVVFVMYATQLLSVLLMLMLIVLVVPKAMISAKRVYDVLETENEATSTFSVDKNSSDDVVLSFKNVSFKYPGVNKYTLKNIDLSIRRGEKIAVIGSTGSGKSTMVSLIPRLYEVTEGEIILYGNNVKEYDLNSLRKDISIVTQKETFFKGSIAENICLGEAADGIDKTRLQQSIEYACLSDTVEQKGGAYSGAVFQNGLNFSGGQRQRLSIARALYKNNDFLILDECTSALDYKTEKDVLDNIYGLSNDLTTIIIGKKISSFKSADRIIVFDEGEIVGIGTHDQLLDNCDVYKQLVKSQLS